MIHWNYNKKLSIKILPFDWQSKKSFWHIFLLRKVTLINSNAIYIFLVFMGLFLYGFKCKLCFDIVWSISVLCVFQGETVDKSYMSYVVSDIWKSFSVDYILACSRTRSILKRLWNFIYVPYINYKVRLI